MGARGKKWAKGKRDAQIVKARGKSSVAIARAVATHTRRWPTGRRSDRAPAPADKWAPGVLYLYTVTACWLLCTLKCIGHRAFFALPFLLDKLEAGTVLVTLRSTSCSVRTMAARRCQIRCACMAISVLSMGLSVCLCDRAARYICALARRILTCAYSRLIMIYVVDMHSMPAFNAHSCFCLICYIIEATHFKLLHNFLLYS